MGKMNKFYSENCLLQQEFVKDNAMTVEQYIASAAKADKRTHKCGKDDYYSI